MDDKQRSRAELRLCAAMIGTSALVAMAAIGLMVAHEHDGYAVAKSPSVGVASTSTQTTPSTAPAVGVVEPNSVGDSPVAPTRLRGFTAST
jgi:hypothetical protein